MNTMIPIETAAKIFRLSGILATLLLFLSGCEKDEGVKVRLVIDSEVSAPAGFDAIDVAVTASASAEGRVCAPANHTFSIAGSEDLPVIVYYLVGPAYGEWIAFKITWRKGSDTVHAREIIRPITGASTQEIDVTFEASCLGKACPDATQCVAGSCEDRQLPGPFNDPSIVDTSVLCVD